MKFKFVKDVKGSVAIYGGKKAKMGDEVELTGYFATKAKLNPDFEEVVKNGDTESSKNESA